VTGDQFGLPDALDATEAVRAAADEESEQARVARRVDGAVHHLVAARDEVVVGEDAAADLDDAADRSVAAGVELFTPAWDVDGSPSPAAAPPSEVFDRYAGIYRRAGEVIDAQQRGEDRDREAAALRERAERHGIDADETGLLDVRLRAGSLAAAAKCLTDGPEYDGEASFGDPPEWTGAGAEPTFAAALAGAAAEVRRAERTLTAERGDDEGRTR
jgi:hypothetical protein